MISRRRRSETVSAGLRVPVGLALVMLLQGAAGAGSLTGPVYDEGRVVVVEDVVQLPASSGSLPYTRINDLRSPPDGSGRIFVNDLRGPLHVIDGGSVSTYMDFSLLFPDLKTSPGLSSGFVSLAFHPEFATNGLFYTVHAEFVGSTPPNLGPTLPVTVIQHTIVTEWTATDPALNAFAGSSRELLRIESHHNHHNLGELSFNPAAGPGDPDYGLLYLAAGDFGAVQNNQFDQVQRLDTPYGAMLRIDPLGGPFTRGSTTYDYGIPAGNPFASDGDPATLDEIYAYGFRNGHRIAWDKAYSGAAFVACIGEENIEEINVLAPGANYGWPEREGNYAIDIDVSLSNVFALPGNDATFGYTYPVAQYDHDDVTKPWSAIAGIAVYRGDASHDLYGQILFGDIVDGSLFHASVADLLAADDGDPATMAPIFQLGVLRDGAPTTLLAIVEDALGGGQSRIDLRIERVSTGEIYITTKRDGFVRKLLPIEVAYPNGWTLYGTAEGGYLRFVVEGVQLEVATTTGQTPEEIAEAMVAAIQLDGTLQGLGIYSHQLAERVLTNGTTSLLAIGDPGIQDEPLPVPTMAGWARAALTAGLLAAAAYLGRGRRSPSTP